MKIEFNKQQPKFTPIQMVVNIETLEDMCAWYAILNHTRNIAVLGKDIAYNLLIAANEECCVTNGEVIANGVTYSEFYGG